MPKAHATSGADAWDKPRAASASLVGVEVLVLDGDQRVHASIERLLSEAHLHVTCIASTAKALQLVERQFFAVALIDLADQAAGRDPLCPVNLGDLRMLVIDEVDDLAAAMTDARPNGFELVHATSGGEGLDRISSGTFHYAMIAEDVADLPAMTLARAIRDQHPDTVVFTFLGPAANGKVELVETSGTRVLVKPFTDAQQLIARVDELADAWRAKARERRYTQAFREKHYNFLRRYVELRTKIEHAINEAPNP